MNKILLLLCCVIFITSCRAQSCTLKTVTNSRQVQVCKSGIFKRKCHTDTVHDVLYKYGVCDGLQKLSQYSFRNLEKNIKYVEFPRSNISVIATGILYQISGVRVLYFGKTGIQQIVPGAFGGLSMLEILNLNGNSLRTIKTGTINSLPSLSVLDLGYNSLNELEDNCFQGLVSLKKLSLNNNALTYISNKTFSSLKNLEELSLDHNELVNIEFAAFDDLSSLKKLWLAKNKLTNISLEPHGAKYNSELEIVDAADNRLQSFQFSMVRSIKKLFLSRNQIQSVVNWSYMKNSEYAVFTNNGIKEISPIGQNVVKLYLDNNLITFLNSSLFSRSSATLIFLSFSNNSIKDIDVNAFKNLNKLTSLLLDHNEWSDIPIGIFKDLSSLNSLQLSDNALSSLKFGTFAGLNNLQTLQLSNNRFVNFPENSFHVLSKLRSLDLSNNLIESLDANSLLNHLVSLKDIWLDGNAMVCDDLLSVVGACRAKGVNFHKGSQFYVDNVHGTKCYRFIDEVPSRKVTQTPENELVTSEIFEEDVSVSTPFSTVTTTENPLARTLEELREMRENFASDLVLRIEESLHDSTLYRLLNGSVDDLSLVNYLENDFTSGNFAKFFDENGPLRKFFDFANFTETDFYKFFQDEFFRSKFYGYFAEDYRNSDFFEQFNRSLSLLERNNHDIERGITKESSADFIQPESQRLIYDDTRKVLAPNSQDEKYTIFLVLIILLMLIIFMILALIFYKLNALIHIKHFEDLELRQNLTDNV